MKKLKQSLYLYLLATGGGMVLLTVCSIFIREIDYVKYMQVTTVAFIFPNIAHSFIIKYDVTKFEMWLRRILAFMTYPISMTFFAVILGLVENINHYLIICAVMFVPEIIVYVVLVLSVEAVQKKKLEKINEKLKENISQTGR